MPVSPAPESGWVFDEIARSHRLIHTARNLEIFRSVSARMSRRVSALPDSPVVRTTTTRRSDVTPFNRTSCVKDVGPSSGNALIEEFLLGQRFGQRFGQPARHTVVIMGKTRDR